MNTQMNEGIAFRAPSIGRHMALVVALGAGVHMTDAYAVAAASTVIDFDDIALRSASSAPIASHGYVFDASLQGVTNVAGFGASNGTHFLVFFGPSSSLSFAPADHSQFSLNSLQIGGWLSFGATPQTLSLSGQLAGGGVVSTALVVNPGASFQSFAPSGFQGLSALTLSGGPRGYIAVDNIEVMPSPVPEASSFVMMLAGLGLLGGVIRRRERSGSPIR